MLPSLSARLAAFAKATAPEEPGAPRLPSERVQSEGPTDTEQALEPSRQTSDRKMGRERQGQMRVGSRTVSTATSRGKVHFAGSRERDCGVPVGSSASYSSNATRSSYVCRRLMTRHLPSSTRTSGANGRLL